ncbi:hypothetical protein DFQ27_009103 [Actinomortierella ambigua]|uniref:O-methyltransferase C-terminal domain-containing protein n=1 Tax=Actinomortierella ambigua TaxID=1343610 RepID=A0A9P6TY44_9FUNG|nr:hypothetical protein DFQ27_009103 [Actinomortierella ambigua]
MFYQPSLNPSSAHLVTQLVKCISTIENAGPEQIENWETVQARQQAEDLLLELQRLVIPINKRLRYATMGIFENQALYLAVRLGIAQALVDAGPGGVDLHTLASRTGTVAGPLERILRALQPNDVAVQCDDRWVAGEAALALCPGHAASVAAAIDYYGNEMYTIVGFLGKQVAPDCEWPARQASSDTPSPSAAAGSESASQACYAGLGMPSLYTHFAAHTDRQAVFTNAMASLSIHHNDYISADYPWDRHEGQRLCDVGGADGNFFKHLLAKHPLIAGGTVYDVTVTLPPTDAPAKLTFVHGDFFKTVPAGHPVYFMRHILHNWGDSDVRRILSNTRQAMVESLCTIKASEDGNGNKNPVLLIAEAVIAPKAQREAILLDLVMLNAFPGGKERTVEEYSALCEAEGLRIVQVWPTRGKHSILEVHLDLEAKDASKEE